VPSAVWLYGCLRGAAFSVPSLTQTGGVGLGAFVVLVLYVYLVRGSRRAWIALVVLDVIALLLLALSTQLGQTPLLVHILSALALATLLLPSVRRYVTGRDLQGRLR